MSVRRSISLFGMAAVLLAAGGLPTAYAQEDDEQTLADAETRETPALRQIIYEVLAEAQTCAEMGDFECAMEALAEVRSRDDLNSYETALMWQYYAFIYFEQDNLREAMTAYENLLMQPDLPLGLEQQSVRTLAQLYVQEGQYQQALDMIDRWFSISPNPSPDMYVLEAQVHYQMQQYSEGLEPIQTALRIAEEQGIEPEESWYQLLNVFYFELEDYPNVIRTFTILLENWPKKDYLVQLAGMYGQEGREQDMLALFEAGYSAGWLERGTEYVTLAQLLLQAEIPYKAALIIEQGLEEGTIESSESNWRMLSTAWQLAQEHEQAIPALTQAASLSDDGELNLQLARSYANLAQWQGCVDASREALQIGGLDSTADANLMLGTCLLELEEYDAARNAFTAAAQDDSTRDSAQQWLQYLESEVSRQQQLEEATQRNEA